MLIRLRSGAIFHSNDLRNAYFDGEGIVLGFVRLPPKASKTKLDFPKLNEEEAAYVLDEFWNALYNKEQFFDFEEALEEATDEESDSEWEYSDEDFEDNDVPMHVAEPQADGASS